MDAPSDVTTRVRKAEVDLSELSVDKHEENRDLIKEEVQEAKNYKMIEGNNKSTPWTTVARSSWEYAFKVEKYLSKIRREAMKVEATDRPIGVAFSGGGIRSAAYCLGGLRSLVDSGFFKKVDYLSTVSGGGYTGTAFMTHAMAESNKTMEDAVDSLEAQMKENCGYLVDRRSFFTLFRDIIGLFFTVIFLFLFGKIPEFVLSLYPASIVAQQLIGTEFTNSVLSNQDIDDKMKRILLVIGMIGCFLLVITRIGMYALAKNSYKWRTYMILSLLRGIGLMIGFTSACLLAVTVFNDVFEVVFHRNVIYTLAIIAFNLSIAFALTNIVPLEALYLIFPIIGVFFVAFTWFVRISVHAGSYTWNWMRDVNPKNLDISWTVFFIFWGVINTFGSSSLMHVYYAYRLKRSFYSKDPSMYKRLGSIATKYAIDGRYLEPAAKKGVPHLLCNATLNDYKQNPRDPDFYQFCIGSVWTGCEITGYAATSYMDMTWEQAMAISGAAFATSMGRVNIEAVRSNETLFAMIGLTLGDWIRFPTKYELRKSHIAPAIMSLIIWIFMCVGTNLYNQYPWTAYLILVGYLMYAFAFLFNLVPAEYQPTGSYWFSWKQLTEHNQTVGLSTVGPLNPPYLHLSDGGHSDNNGILQLFKRRAKLIISLDASYDPDISCEDLLWALGTIKSDAVIKAEYVKPNGEAKLISIDEAIRRYKNSQADSNGKEPTYIAVRIVWIDDESTTMLYYIKMKRRQTRAMDIDPVMCFGSFPYISTGFQFFNKDMFNRFFEEGRLDTLEFLEKFDKKAFKAAKKAADKREEKGTKKEKKGNEKEKEEETNIDTEVVVQK